MSTKLLPLCLPVSSHVCVAQTSHKHVKTQGKHKEVIRESVCVLMLMSLPLLEHANNLSHLFSFSAEVMRRTSWPMFKK